MFNVKGKDEDERGGERVGVKRSNEEEESIPTN